MRTVIVDNTEDLVETLKLLMISKAEEAISKREKFRVGLSGGSLVELTTKALEFLETDVNAWKFFFCDERFVDVTDKESTFGQYKQCLKECYAKHLKIDGQFVWIDTKLSLEECAEDYERKILKEFNSTGTEIPRFDLLILGIGPDGHTCSLFPEHELLKEQKKLVAHIKNAPKQPPQRITMTLPLINKARCCLFVVTGENKADIVKEAFVEKQEYLPAALVQPGDDHLIYLMDKPAAKYYPSFVQ